MSHPLIDLTLGFNTFLLVGLFVGCFLFVFADPVVPQVYILLEHSLQRVFDK